MTICVEASVGSPVYSSQAWWHSMVRRPVGASLYRRPQPALANLLLEAQLMSPEQCVGRGWESVRRTSHQEAAPRFACKVTGVAELSMKWKVSKSLFISRVQGSPDAAPSVHQYFISASRPVPIAGQGNCMWKLRLCRGLLRANRVGGTQQPFALLFQSVPDSIPSLCRDRQGPNPIQPADAI